MRSEIVIVEMSLVAMPLPPEMEEAYWEAMWVLVELMVREAQSLDGGGLRSES